MPTFIHSNIIGDVYIFKHLRNIAHRVKIVSDFAQDLFFCAVHWILSQLAKQCLVLVLVLVLAVIQCFRGLALYHCVYEGRAGKLCLIT